MIDKNNSLSLLKKEEWLKDSPVCSNVAVCEKIYSEDVALSQLHFHEFVEISVVVDGSGIHRILGEAVECGVGDVYIINTGVPHAYFAKNDKEKPTVCNLLFDPSDVFTGDIASSENPCYCYGVFKENALTAYIRLDCDMLDDIKNILTRIENEALKKQPQWQASVRAYLENLLICLGRCKEKPVGNMATGLRLKDRFMVSETMRAVTENYSDCSLTLETIAETMFISKSYLSRIFTKATGEHFSDYVRNVRIRQACRLLKETDKSNEQIVYECGMKDLPTFYKLFKKQFSLTPNQYRKMDD